MSLILNLSFIIERVKSSYMKNSYAFMTNVFKIYGENHYPNRLSYFPGKTLLLNNQIVLIDYIKERQGHRLTPGRIVMYKAR